MSRRHFPRLACLLLLTLPACQSDPGHFEDLVVRDDLEHVSYSGDNNWYLIDTLGTGLGAGDLDGDGLADLYLLTGSAITSRHRKEAGRHRTALWRNTGTSFEDITELAGVGQGGWSNGATFADIEGDGDLDIYVARHGPNQLWRNEGDGTFVEVAVKAGVADGRWGLASSFADFDGDGDLDIYVTNYGEFDIEEQRDTVEWFTVRQFPHYFPATDNVLYRNEGNGTYVDVTREAGPAGVPGTGRSMTSLAADFDGDGDIDIFVANDIGFNDLYQNDGSMHFENVAVVAGVASDAEGRFQASMGATCGDYDNDGDLDIAVTNYGGEYHTLYRNDTEDGFLLFTDVTAEVGLVHQGTLDSVGWGVGLHDLDLDGHLDYFSVNGHIVEGIAHSSLQRPWWLPDWVTGFEDDLEDLSNYPQMMPEAFNLPARQPKHFFLGSAGGRFEDVSARSGAGIISPRMSRGAAFADFDGDGRLDVAVSNKNQNVQVLLNRLPARGRWLRLDLRDESPNPFAVGARVRVRVGERWLTRWVLAGASYCSSNEYPLHFGLGQVDNVDAIQIRWPGGQEEEHADLTPDAVYRIRRGAAPRRLSAEGAP